MSSKDKEKSLVCTFCGKNQAEVKKLIAGPSIFICDECVNLCNDIIAEEALPSVGMDTNKKILLTPKELYKKLEEHVNSQFEGKLEIEN